MHEALGHIMQFTNGLTYEEYSQDFKLRLALLKLLEIVGEAARFIGDDTRLKFSDIEWETLYVVRNILVHEYFGVDYAIIWRAIQEKVPTLHEKPSVIIQQTDNQGYSVD